MTKHDIIAKLSRCANVNEVIATAKENGKTLTNSQAQDLMQRVKRNTCELSDSELGGVSGGTGTKSEYTDNPKVAALLKDALSGKYTFC